MHILRLKIENVRAIETLELDLRVSQDTARRRLIILGGNGSGKTTILSVIAHFFAQELNISKAVKLNAGDVRMKPSRESPGVSADRAARPGMGELSMDLCTTAQERGDMVDGDHSDIPRTFSLWAMVNSPFKYTVLNKALARALRQRSANSSSEHVAGDSEPLVGARHVLDKVSTPACVLLPADRGTMSDFDSISVGSLTEFEPQKDCLVDERYRFRIIPSLLALAFVAPRRNDPEGAIARMWKVMAKYFPEMPRPVDVHGLRMLFETADGTMVSLPQLSDGQRAILLIMGELALRNPAHGVVLIDEIEQHLHPRWQRAILDALMALLPDAQFILTSQAPYIAASAPDDVITIGDWARDGQ